MNFSMKTHPNYGGFLEYIASKLENVGQCFNFQSFFILATQS